MQDYSISKSTRKCSVSGRSLEPGESYVSVIISGDDDDDNVRRVDIAASEWKGPIEGTIGFWRCKMPAAEAKKLRPAPTGVLLDTLSDLLERPGQETLAYLLAVLLVRRRVLSEEESIAKELDGEEASDTHWALVCNADGRQWNVPIVMPAADTMSAVKEELSELLFTEE